MPDEGDILLTQHNLNCRNKWRWSRGGRIQIHGSTISRLSWIRDND